MSEPELPGIPPPPKAPWYKRLRTRPFGHRKWPGWLAFLYLVITEVPDWGHRLEFWFDTVKAMGGALGFTALVVASSYFRWALFAGSLAYLVFVGEPKRGVQRHYWWPYVGWVVFGICLTAIVTTAGWGVIQVYIQAQIQHGIETQQLPDRGLSQDDINHIQQIFRHIASEFPNSIQVEAVSASPDAAGYAQQFMQAFHDAGLTVNGIAPTDDRSMLFPSSAQVSSSQLRGLFVGVRGGIEPTAIPPHAIRFQAGLTQAGFQASFIGWQGIAADDFVFVVSYR